MKENECVYNCLLSIDEMVDMCEARRPPDHEPVEGIDGYEGKCWGA